MLKSRKKMLLSSIAMLLVALVALGSATFAWYFTNNTVTAETTQFSAASSDGLVIRHVNVGSDGWSDKITDLVGNVAGTDNKAGLTPASITYSNLSSLRGGTGQSDAFDHYQMDGDPTYVAVPTAQTNTNSYFLVDKFWVASSNSQTDNDVQFNVKCSTVADSTKYLNLAVYVGNTLTKVITWDNSNSGTVGKFKDGSTANSVVVDTNTYSGVVKAAATVDCGKISCGPKGGVDSGTCITIIGFADGFNSRCKSSSVDTTVGTVTFEFTT